MRISRVVLLLGGWSLAGMAPAADPLGTAFHRLVQGRVTHASLGPEVKAIAVYYGASWCGPCRAFAPELIAAYPRLRARRIEVLFVSDDATCASALDYARTSRMPWLLLPCDRPRHARLRALGGTALPGLVLLDRDGRFLMTSWKDPETSAPRRALADMLAGPR